MPVSDSPRVLVLTAPVDPTADMVIAHLKRDGWPTMRVDPARFPTGLGFTAEIAPRTCWETKLGRTWLDSVESIYYRRPGRFEFDPAIPPEMVNWCEGQARFGFWGVLESLPAAWINSPAAVHRAEYKPRQLEHAAAAGLMFPPTLITNDPRAVSEFGARHHEGGIITKTLYSRMPRTDDGRLSGIVYTKEVPRNRTRDPSIAATAHLFQTKLRKRFDLRVTVVGGEVFATRIDNPDELDWRRGRHNIAYQPYEMPENVLVGVRRLMRSLGLVFGALDFVVTDEGHHFLEINPNGQWGWIENETGQHISRAIADVLMNGTTP
jgi:ATP-grasp ribosomal peptide maturase